MSLIDDITDELRDADCLWHTDPHPLARIILGKVIAATTDAVMQRCDQLYVEGRISTMGQAAIEETIETLGGES